jgi:Flp pilus assembly pilin Flp
MMLTSMALSASRVIRGNHGAVSTEYVVLVGTMGLALVFALVAVGPTLVRDFQATRTVIAAPYP